MNGSRALGLPLFFLAQVVWVTACGEDHHHDHEAMSPSCREITEACHAADTGSGFTHDCHALAHEDVEDDCAAEKAECIAACEAALD